MEQKNNNYFVYFSTPFHYCMLRSILPKIYIHFANPISPLRFLYQAPLGATSCSKCHCCLGWWAQGRRKSPPVWVLTSPELLCGSPPSLTASRHNWDCRWTSWPLSWSTTQTQWVIQTPTVTIYINLDIQQQTLAFMNFHRSLLVVGRCVEHGDKTTLSPLASKHKAPMGPHRTSDSEFRSQCCDDKRLEIIFATGCNLSFFDFHNCSHGYLAAGPTARCYVHGPTLQTLPPGVVSTAASADIVQLQRGTNGTGQSVTSIN